MVIDRINKIKSHRIFREFLWPQNLPNFKEKNLFYGWNGTGKSTLSNLFRSIEKRTVILEGEVEFHISGNKVDGSTLSKLQKLPPVRVFNKDFIADNVFTSHGAVSPIFFLGEENIEKQKQVEKLKGDLELAKKKAYEKKTEKHQLEKVFDDFKKERSKSIKDLLSSSGGNNLYNNYDKRSFQIKCDELLNLTSSEQKEKILGESDLDAQKKKKESSPLDKLPLIKFNYPDTQKLTNQVVALLKKTVVSSVIETLKNDQELSGWVKTGLAKHKKAHSNDCLFCGQTLPDGRIRELDAHFNDEYNAFIAEIESHCSIVESAIDSLKSCPIPNRLALYDHLKNEFDAHCQDLTNEIYRVNEYLETLLTHLKDKAKKPFQSIEGSFDLVTGNVSVIFDLNEVISKHNQETDDFQTAIIAARTAIEESVVVQSLVEYQQKKKAVNIAASDHQLTTDKIAALEKEIYDVEKDIEEHRRPANELNADIRSYLGRDELSFEIQGNGYQINRNGTPATNLSEGEKTAIAFLYFLKSLSDKSFSLKDGIVVIDDPVSSLDSNALFYAFGFMKERTKDAGQLFILTHNHSFFRQVKNWFNHLPNQNKKNVDLKPGRFYMLISNEDGGSRSSYITVLDRLLHEYESEYHYLFSLVFEAANYEKNEDLLKNYHLTNIARRLLEAFLAFRQPSKTGDLRQQLDLIDFDIAKKTRILRFLHTYSHAEQISDPEHDPSILIETKQVLNDLLCLIENEDKRHFDQMKELIKK
ncbi:AAA family ATPase [Legionella bozemanae]|uniref:AAA family ATPase n=1 Tax=Legionella bozemanae TaxID=447 RepID=UPI0013EF99D1|nr:AAA family ATPase [Legionella bozemanae]